MPDNPGKANHRDIIVIGASAGGVEALRVVAENLPADFEAALFVVLHIGIKSTLAGILDRAGPLPAADAEDGEPIRRGRIYIAPYDVHMLLSDDHVVLRHGPKENMARPAVDPLFRSAALAFGPRTIGVILTGGLSDGTAGLHAIKRCGGIALVQDPKWAVSPGMPESALRNVAVDYCTELEEIGPLLARLVAEPAGAPPKAPAPEDIAIETAVAEREEKAPMEAEDRLGKLSPLSCPECNGPLWEITDRDLLRYRCHTGHAYNADVLLAAKSEETERLLWNILRDYQQHSELVRRMAAREREKHHDKTA
ncbi:MAG TPA: chemotaxis protein CheB, partial [Alphaproteobacteria bacterium]|nr:chemotaxis protein CheB [Alphaproteobacteria bacterium]